MKITQTFLLVSLSACLMHVSAHGQNTPAPATSVSTDQVRVFHLKNPHNPDELTVLVNILRSQFNFAPISGDYTQNAIVATMTPEKLASVQKLIEELDQPARSGDEPQHKSFRLTYTLTESEDGKRISLQHFSTVIAEGAKTVLKDGSNVPIPTGRPVPGDMVQQFTYLDVGLNIESALDTSTNGERLRTKIEQAGAVVDQSTGVQNPVKRQAELELTAYLIPGKPLVLGAFDVPGSGRHVDVEALLEPLR